MVAQRDSRDSWVKINLDHIADNIQAFQEHLPNSTAIMAVVKADAYGHGAVRVANKAIRAGASWLGVALLSEALELRQAGISVPILVFGRVRSDDAGSAARNHISLTVFQLEWLREARRLGPKDPPLQVHLNLDTGMGRLGVREMLDLRAMVQVIQEASCFHLQGVYTHFATADEGPNDYFMKQFNRFQKMLAALKKWGVTPALIHCANSATALNFPAKVFNLVRLGISMYGLAPSEEMKPNLPFSLQPAFTLHSRLIQVKQLKAGEAVSYGATYVAKGKEWIATVPLGYADGWLRNIATGGEVLVEGERVPIVGRICMDFFMIRLPAQKDIGAKVTLIGRQHDACIEVDEVARLLDTINYEIPCMISDRVPRKYVET